MWIFEIAGFKRFIKSQPKLIFGVVNYLCGISLFTLKIPQNLAEILTQRRSPLYLTMLVSNCVFASRSVSKGLKILRFLNPLLLLYKWQQRACFWEGNFKKSQSLTSMLYNFWNLAKLKRFWHQNTNCSTKTQPQTHRCLSMFKFFKEIRKVYLNSTGNSQGS